MPRIGKQFHVKRDRKNKQILANLLKNNYAGISVVTGYSANQLRDYIESKWEPGMTWENYGRTRNCWNLVFLKRSKCFDPYEMSRTMLALSNLKPKWIAMKNVAGLPTLAQAFPITPVVTTDESK